MSSAASTDSFETFKTDELAEYALKSISPSISDDDYRMMQEMVNSSAYVNCYSDGPAALNEDGLDQSLISSPISGGSWQDLTQDMLDVYVRQLDTSDSYFDKQAAIVDELRNKNNGNLLRLRKLGFQEGGFLCDSLRQLVWPRLARVDIVETSPWPDQETMASHYLYQQVVIDVGRSLRRSPPSIDEDQRLSLEGQLVRLIMRVLMKNPGLQYYQGYHSICAIFLTILGEEMTFHLVNRFSKTHFAIFMQDSMDTITNHLELITMLIERESPSLAIFLHASGVGTAFSLGWVTTWFSQNLKNHDTVGRLFDLFLFSDKHMPLYLTAAILLYREEEILKLDCDMNIVHQHLSRLLDDEEKLPFEQLIAYAATLYKTYPPDVLNGELQLLIEKRQKAEQSRQRIVAIRNLFTIRGLFGMAKSPYGLAILVVVTGIGVSVLLHQRQLIRVNLTLSV